MVVLITGCRSGFGLCTARLLAQQGHTVYAGLRDLETAGRLRESTAGLSVFPLQLDVTDSAQRMAAVEQITSTEGRIDALVNNAGIIIGGPLEEFSEEELRRVFEVNFFGLWALTQAVLPGMRALGRGTIVNVSSMSGRMGMPTMGAYAASKHALSGMSESLRMELQPFGVRVVLIEPGPYKTDIFSRNQRICAGAQRPESPYRTLVDRAAVIASRAEASGGDPLEVAARIAAVLVARNPPLRNPMGPNVLLRRFARWILPPAVFEAIVLRVMGRN